MEIDYVNNKQLLEPINFKSEIIFSKNDLQITIDNSTNIVSLNQNREEPKKFKTLFKNYFLFEPPKISELRFNKKYMSFWVRTNSFFIVGDVNPKDLNYVFSSTASITDQTGGWLSFKISGKGSIHLFEKLITINLENFNEGNVIRTSISKINCFVFCKKKDETYYIICPVSFSNAMRSRLIQLMELS